jgi:ATP-binding cassette, subfamily B, bacterial
MMYLFQKSMREICRPIVKPALSASSSDGRGLLRRALRELLPDWKMFSLIFTSIVAGAICALIPPLLIRMAIDYALPHKDLRSLYVAVGSTVAAAIIGGLIGVWRNNLSNLLGQGVIFEIRCRLYERLTTQSLSFFSQTRVGDILSRIYNDVGGLQNVVSGTFVTAFYNLVLVLVTLVVIFVINWRLALLASIVLPMFVWPARQAGQARGRISKQTQERVSDMNSLVQETFSVGGFLLLRIFGAGKYELERFRATAAAIRDLRVRESRIGRWFLMWIALFATIGPALIYLVGGREVVQGTATVGTLVAFVAYLAQLYAPVSLLAGAHLELTAAIALLRRIYEYLDLPCELGDSGEPVALQDVMGTLEFKDVSLYYTPDSIGVSRVSFTVPAGQMVAIVGPSGAGKTTLTYLAMRLYDPSAGTVTLDSSDLRSLPLAEVSRRIAYVPQETTLFNATVAENLRYAKRDATDQELAYACKLAQLHDVIGALPERYDTKIGERGYKLSGGERQRLALARVLLREPKILILDEATSSLDSRSEALIQEALETVLRGRTSIVVAHRLSTIMRADQIIVLDKGVIVEKGTHHDLLMLDGLYAKLHATQFRDALQEPPMRAAEVSAR